MISRKCLTIPQKCLISSKVSELPKSAFLSRSWRRPGKTSKALLMISNSTAVAEAFSELIINLKLRTQNAVTLVFL